MARSKKLTVCLALGLAGCGSPRHAAPAPGPAAAPASHARATPAPPAPRPSRASWMPAMPAPDPWAVAGWPWSGSAAPMFIDHGAALLMIDGTSLTLVDPRRRAVVDAVSLRSVSVPDRAGTPVQGGKREQDLYSATWSWDPARGTAVVAGCLAGSGQVARGLSVWAPGLSAVPTPVAGAGKREDCLVLALSADASRILARTAANTVQLFAVATASPVGAPIKLAQDPGMGAISPDGAWLAISVADGDVALYEVGAGRLETLAHGRNQGVRKLIFDPVRPVLVVLGDVEAVAWDLPTRTPTHLADGVDDAAFSADGKVLGLAAREVISIRDGATLQPARSLEISKVTNVEALAFSPDASLLAVKTGHALEIRELGAAGPPAAFDRRWFDQLHPLPVPGPAREPAFTRDGVVEGRVTLAGRPVAGAEIRMVPREAEWPRARALAAITRRTGADGAIRIIGVPRIDWQVRVTAPGLTMSGWIAELRQQPKVTGEAKLEKAVTIQGIVLGPDGRPAANAHVFHDRTESTGEVALTTAADGMFTIDHLRRDSDSSYGRDGYELQAWRADGAVVTAKTMFKDLGPIKITLRLRAPDDPHVVRLKLVDEHGAPVPGASVELAPAVKHRSDAQGMFATDAEPRVNQDGRVGVQIIVDDDVRDEQIAWPAHGVVTVAIRRSAPPGTLLPLACTLYQHAIERLAHCDRVPQATREALTSELERAAATWADHPDRAEFDCSLNQRIASETARLCP